MFVKKLFLHSFISIHFSHLVSKNNLHQIYGTILLTLISVTKDICGKLIPCSHEPSEKVYETQYIPNREFLSPSVRAVSYTHLDVYKRQVQ